MSVLAGDVLLWVRRQLGLLPGEGEAHGQAEDVAEAPSRGVSDALLLGMLSAEEASLVHEVKAQHAFGYALTCTVERGAETVEAAFNEETPVARILFVERAASAEGPFVRALPVEAGEVQHLAAMGRHPTAALPVWSAGARAASGVSAAVDVLPPGGVVRLVAAAVPPPRLSPEDTIPLGGAALSALVFGVCARAETSLALDEAQRAPHARLYTGLRSLALARAGRTRREGAALDYAARGRLEDHEVTVE